MDDLLNEIRVHKVRTLKTFVLCLIFIGLGIYGATPGVTLLDLQVSGETGSSSDSEFAILGVVLTAKLDLISFWFQSQSE